MKKEVFEVTQEARYIDALGKFIVVFSFYDDGSKRQIYHATDGDTIQKARNSFKKEIAQLIKGKKMVYKNLLPYIAERTRHTIEEFLGEAYR